MKIFHSLPEKVVAEQSIIVLGNFDGVHRGHQSLISLAVEKAKQQGLKSIALTFEPHPMKFLRPEKFPGLILTNNKKKQKINALGIDKAIFLPFDKNLASMAPEKFVELVLSRLNPYAIIIGFNYSYGYQGRGSAETLIKAGRKMGFSVEVLPPQKEGNELISSSAIRYALNKGDLEEARRLLGFWPILEGKVICGDRRGRTLGFPTANLDIDEDILLPPLGAYATRAILDHNVYLSVMNIGCKPTFGDENRLGVEVHLLDFEGDLYGKELELHMIKHLRPELKFANAQELVKQINADIDATRQLEKYL